MIKIGIALFCLWHMFSIAVYALPSNAHDRFSTWARDTVRPVVTPYIFATSQWQQWNLFSPDPLRRVTSYVLQTRQGLNWDTVAVIDRQTVPWHQLTREMKMLSNIEMGSESLNPVREQLLQTYCDMYHIAPGMQLRMVYDMYVLPLPEKPLTTAQWKQLQPAREQIVATEVTCRSPLVQ